MPGPLPAAPAAGPSPLPPANDFNYLRDLVRSKPGATTDPTVPSAAGAGSEGGFFAPEKKGISYGVVGGIIMMAIAVVWFVVGYSLGWIFYYPPIFHHRCLRVHQGHRNRDSPAKDGKPAGVSDSLSLGATAGLVRP